jgi:small subunit ribosomal protein S16
VLRMRLRRVGAKKQALYRIVIAENEWPRDGRFLEVVGNYNPRTNPEWIELDEARVYHWLSNGAGATSTVERLLTKTGALDRYQRFKKGEALETLLEEAKAAAETAKANTSLKTRPDKPVPSTKNKAKKTEAAAA